MVLLKPKSNRVPPLLQALLWFPHHLEQEPSPNNGPRGLTTSGPSTTLISSLPSCPLAQLLVSHRAFLLAARYIPTSGPLKLLFPLPGVLFPRRPHDPLLTFFTSLLTCHVLGQVFLEHPSYHCSLHPSTPHLPALYFPKALSTSQYTVIYLISYAHCLCPPTGARAL